MRFVFNDGGRASAGYKGTAGDCFARAVAIVTGKPYAEVYGLVNQHRSLVFLGSYRWDKAPGALFEE